MKKTVLLAVIAALTAGFTFAAPCIGGDGGSGFLLFSGGVAVGSNPISCSVTAPSNSYITSVTVISISDLTNGASTPSFDITTSVFTPTLTGTSNGSLVPLSPSPLTITGAAQVLSTGGLSGNTDQSLLAVTLSFTATSAKTPGFTGTANGSSIDASGITGLSGTALGQQSGVFFTYAAIPETGVPEPTTLSLVGGALLAVGFLARKK